MQSVNEKDQRIQQLENESIRQIQPTYKNSPIYEIILVNGTRAFEPSSQACILQEYPLPMEADGPRPRVYPA
ncbi:MAG: hypothetical protein APF77_24360 [Clostridia bacterium BRH_c25]|nr:MAG: hypothetical protein APF77_24360 [Clostridia bacterium BRH_c25]